MTAPSATIPAYRAFETTVLRVARLSPNFVRVTFHGVDLDLFGDTCLDQRVKVVLPRAVPAGGDPYATFPRDVDWWPRWREMPAEERNPLRTFTVRGVRQQRAEVDIDFALHGDIGPASRWAATARPGDPCVLIGPDVRGDSAHVGIEWKPGNATSLLIVGDETAVPAASAILERLPPHATGQVFLEVPGHEDVLDLAAPTGMTVTWLPREPGTAPGERLTRDVPDALNVGVRRPAAAEENSGSTAAEGTYWDTPDSEPDSGCFAWIAGEAGAVKTLRRLLVGYHGWDRRNVAFMGYWRLGRSEV